MKRGKPIQRRKQIRRQGKGPRPVPRVRPIPKRLMKDIMDGAPQFRVDTMRKNGGICARPFCRERARDPHHVVYRNKLEKVGQPQWDPDDGLPLCRPCHHAHHYAPGGELPLTCLGDENIAFAFRTLGAHAFDYLRRRYAGHDPRLDSHLAAAEPADEGSD